MPTESFFFTGDASWAPGRRVSIKSMLSQTFMEAAQGISVSRLRWWTLTLPRHSGGGPCLGPVPGEVPANSLGTYPL